MIFMAGGNAYSLVHEHKTGWNPEAFRERYSEVLERFDYIVGDWGYNQLRLRGFYRDGHPRATKESTISSFVDYINEYCNFGCAHFVLTKVDSSALPPGAEISQEETPEAIIAMSETGEQAAETAAALSNGPIMRWPLKERAGGPARVPNITVSAVARAAADAERRNASANSGRDGSNGASSSQPRGNSYKGQDGGHNNRQGRSYNNGSSGGDRRSNSNGQGNGVQASNRQSTPRGPRQSGGEQQASRAPVENRPIEARQPESRGPDSSQANQARQDASRGDNRWHGKNRRRKTFGGKPGPRPEGAARPEAGAPRSSE
ncbi:DUF1027 domain-containing protein [Cohnella endophytica]|uniref:DUF1027 domain-containing protein n=1 Tax=Cohnella endophytica TaxID=2419778 RepID=A0A494Y018_9BACL|nr:YutD-like domain-containing protein [Cohnella endophytica]RKP56107.1 DUF1027 domain-containing protein [Cohnella endophytica]